MPVSIKPIMLKVSNPAYVQSLAESLENVYTEMINININNTPIKNSTKYGWEFHIKEVVDWMNKIKLSIHTNDAQEAQE